MIVVIVEFSPNLFSLYLSLYLYSRFHLVDEPELAALSSEQSGLLYYITSLMSYQGLLISNRIEFSSAFLHISSSVSHPSFLPSFLPFYLPSFLPPVLLSGSLRTLTQKGGKHRGQGTNANENGDEDEDRNGDDVLVQSGNIQ